LERIRGVGTYETSCAQRLRKKKQLRGRKCQKPPKKKPNGNAGTNVLETSLDLSTSEKRRD